MVSFNIFITVTFTRHLLHFRGKDMENKTLWFDEHLAYTLELFTDQQQLEPVIARCISEVLCTL